MTKITLNYNPPLLLKSAHFNTIWSSLTHGRPVVYKRETFSLSDGDFLNLDHIYPKKQDSVTLLLHGLEGTSQSTYITQFIQSAGKQQSMVCMNQRGCGGELNTKPYSYHSGKTSDLNEVVEHLLRDYKQVHIVGFSMGGNIALKWAGDLGDQCPASTITAISAPLHLASTAHNLAKSSAVIYLRPMLTSLKDKLKKKSQTMAIPNLEGLMQTKSFIDFDELHTAPINGFEDANDYWQKCSSLPVLKQVSVPSMIIVSKDDPFLTHESVPERKDLNVATELHITSHGGHLGFSTGVFGRKKWYTPVVHDFIRKHNPTN